uniref:F-box domain-containing protein n=1 Tax=Leersia perrieri TaxID=77586 RepID=A0A0D9W0R5_9ORYZ
MDSTSLQLPVLTQKKRRRQDASTFDHLSGGGDLISSLDDDVLLHILGLLPTITDVVRTCSVSRRWRHLDALVPILRFINFHGNNYDDLKRREKLDQFMAFLNRQPVLTQKRRRQDASTSDHLGTSADVDLISSLDDDVLVHILGLLPTITDVVRACSASRRWHRLEPCVPFLRFNFDEDGDDTKQREKLDQFIPFVNRVLVRRIGQSDGSIKELEISLMWNYHHYTIASERGAIDIAQIVHAWIPYGMQHVV